MRTKQQYIERTEGGWERVPRTKVARALWQAKRNKEPIHRIHCGNGEVQYAIGCERYRPSRIRFKPVLPPAPDPKVREQNVQKLIAAGGAMVAQLNKERPLSRGLREALFDLESALFALAEPFNAEEKS